MLCTPLLRIVEVDWMESNEENNPMINQNEHLEDCGSISIPLNVLVDYGTLEPTSNHKTCFIAVGGTDDESGETGIKVCGKSEVVVNIKSFIPHDDLNTDEIIYYGIILTWIGFGTVFELGNGSERITSPYLASGTVR